MRRFATLPSRYFALAGDGDVEGGSLGHRRPVPVVDGPLVHVLVVEDAHPATRFRFWVINKWASNSPSVSGSSAYVALPTVLVGLAR